MRSTKKAALFGAAMTAIVPAIALANPDEGEVYLGVSLQALEGGLAEALDMKKDSGVLVSQVMSESPAEVAGIKSGDIIVAIGGAAVGTPSGLRREIGGHKAGEKVTVAYLRDGKRATVDVELREAPEGRRFHEPSDLRLGGDRGYLGVLTQPLSGGLDEYFGAPEGGALVSEVVAESPAAKLGLKAGDVIVAIDGTEITNPEDLRQVVREFEEAKEVEVAWIRNKQKQTGRTMLEVREAPAFRMPRFAFGSHDFGFDSDHMRRQVVDVLGEQQDSLREALEAVQKELEVLREEVNGLKKGD
jgi:membrane-associated protease RseP (regulator of RpoE activity)